MKLKMINKLESNENELKKVQKILLNQMSRLDDEEIMKQIGNREMKRSNAISQSASAYVKSIQTQIKVLDLTQRYNTNANDINKFLGIDCDK